MLLIVSDLHLTDGPASDSGAFQIFSDRLQDVAIRASWRADGQYRPLEQLDLILLGDVLDIINSAKWLDTEVRPWHDPDSTPVADTVASIVDGILAANRDAISYLRCAAAEGAIRIPPAGQAGEPVYSAEGLPLAVRTFYMVGNRDWPLHLGGPRYDAIRQRVAHQMGLANVPTAPFPHDPYESDELLSVLRRHRVFARHGDIFDPINYCEDRDGSSLGDALVIELINRFAATIEQQLGGELPAAVTAGLAEANHLRPLLQAPLWLEGLLARHAVRPPQRKLIKQTWDGLVDALLELAPVRQQGAWSAAGLIDGLHRALKFSQQAPSGWAGQIDAWLKGLRGSAVDSYFPHALAEQDFRNRRARHIVYGHTHAAEAVPLDASYADGYVLNQMYFNSGTWRRVYRPTQWSVGQHEFIPTETMTYLAFFHADERGGRPFETWSGTLAAGTAEAAVHRVDAGRTSHAAEESIPAPKVPLRAPHFARPAAPARGVPSRRLG